MAHDSSELLNSISHKQQQLFLASPCLPGMVAEFSNESCLFVTYLSPRCRCRGFRNPLSSSLRLFLSGYWVSGCCSAARNSGGPTWVLLDHLANGSDLVTRKTLLCLYLGNEEQLRTGGGATVTSVNQYLFRTYWALF